MARKKMQLEPGRKYKGYGWLNEYGQINFQASQQGTCENKMALVKESETFSLYESKQYLKVAVKIEKKLDKIEIIKQFMNAFKAACVELKNYDIS